MALRPEVFISAAAPEMNALRKVVKHALLEIGARPVEQGDFTIEYGPLHGVLNQTISRCSAVIHLLGFQYGLEPAERTLHAPRRSFTHYEIDVAQKLAIPIYTFDAGMDCPLNPFAPESDEARTLQRQHRTALLGTEGFHESFASPEELSRRVRALRSRIIVRRSLARLPNRPLGTGFIGRTRLLEDLKAAIAPGTIHFLQPVQSMNTLGGAGTSTLAVELAWRLYDQGKLDFVFWLPAGVRADFEATLASLARTDSLALLPDEVASHRARLNAVLAWFAQPEHTGRFLLVVDGVDSETEWWALKSFLPAFAGGTVILTGRHPAAAGMLMHAVAPFSVEQSVEFLAGRLNLVLEQNAAERPFLERLADLLGRVPLALHLLASHLKESRIAPKQFLASLADPRAPGAARGTLDLAGIFERTTSALDPTARSLLRLIACLAPEPAAIPLAVFEQRSDWPLTSVALTALDRRGLLQRDESSRTVRIHRALRELARDRLASGQAAEALGTARPALEATLQRAAESGESANPGLREQLIPHCRALLGQLNGHPLEIHAANLSRGLAEWLSDCGRPVEAEVFSRRALTIDERKLGPDQPEVAMRLRDLASILRTLRRLPEAEEHYRRALAIDEVHAGVDSPEAANDLYQIAACLRQAGDLAGAEELCRRAWHIEEQHCGPDHPKVAIAVHRLACLLEVSARPLEAKALFRRALQIDEAGFGQAHPRLPVRLYHLARLLAFLRERTEARQLFERALALEEQKLRADHPEMASVLVEYAVLLEDSGRASEAEKAYRRVLQLHERTFGPDHLETILSQANLAAFLGETGRAEEALPLHEAALAALLRLRGRWRGAPPHLRSLLANYAAELRRLGHSEEEAAERQRPFLITGPRRERSRFLDED